MAYGHLQNTGVKLPRTSYPACTPKRHEIVIAGEITPTECTSHRNVSDETTHIFF